MNEKWYSNAFHDPGWDHRPKIELWLKDATAPYDSDEYGRDEHFYIAPLLTGLHFSPDITATPAKKLCPYSDTVLTVNGQPGWGLGFGYNLFDDLNDLIVSFEGGDCGHKDLTIEPQNKRKGSGFRGKWEGFDDGVTENASIIVKYPNENTDKNAPKWVIKEGEYKFLMEMKRKDDATQEQSFEVPFTVKYR